MSSLKIILKKIFDDCFNKLIVKYILYIFNFKLKKKFIVINYFYI